MTSKACSAEESVAKIPDGVTIVIGGTGVAQEPDLVLKALEKRFLETGHPCYLTLFSPTSAGDRAGEGGLNCFAHEGMTSRVIGSSFNRTRYPKLVEMLISGACEGYFVGMGTMIQLLTAAGSGKPGVFTKAGLGSFMDPRQEAGCLNKRSTNPSVRIEVVDGEEYLFYPAPKIDVAIIRGTTADENGYISMEEETNNLGMSEMAMATRANGGQVIAQVKRMARAGSLDPRLVRIPGPLISDVVVNSRQLQLSTSMSEPLDGWNPFLAGALKHPLTGLPPIPSGSMRMIIKRSALELRANDIVNLGAGMATHIPRIAHEYGVLDDVVFTNEHGVFGGLMGTALGGSFVPALNAEAIMDSAFQFNFYDGGGLDITFLGIGQVDASGNINVSRFNKELFGPGGFNNIIERTPRIVFCGSLTSGGLKTDVKDGKLCIVQEGRHAKFVSEVEQITFNAKRGFDMGQTVRYVTERAVFELRAQGIVLIEVAPGIDVERDIKPNVGFPLQIADNLCQMRSEIFTDAPMDLKSSLNAKTHIKEKHT